MVCLIRVSEYLNSTWFLLLHFKQGPRLRLRSPHSHRSECGALRSLAAELGLRYGEQPVALLTGGLAREPASLQEGKSRINTLCLSQV